VEGLKKTEHERESCVSPGSEQIHIHPVQQQDQRQLLAGSLGTSASRAGTMWTDSPLLRDAGAAVLTGVAMAAVLCFGKEVANPRAAGPGHSFALLSSSLAVLQLPRTYY
jgi:hypothetical protein